MTYKGFCGETGNTNVAILTELNYVITINYFDCTKN